MLEFYVRPSFRHLWPARVVFPVWILEFYVSSISPPLTSRSGFSPHNITALFPPSPLRGAASLPEKERARRENSCEIKRTREEERDGFIWFVWPELGLSFWPELLGREFCRNYYWVHSFGPELLSESFYRNPRRSVHDYREQKTGKGDKQL